MLNEPVRGALPQPGAYSLSGLELLRAYSQQRLPRTPHAALLGYRVTQASSGSAVISQPITPWLDINGGFVDLSMTAELSVFLAALTAAAPATTLRVVTLSLRYLRPCTIDDESVIARSRVLHAGSNFTTVESFMEDGLGRAVAHATGCVLTSPIDPPPPPFVMRSDAEGPVDEPVYPTPDPIRRRLPASLDQVMPPAAAFLGLKLVEASDVRAVTTMATTEWFCNVGPNVEAGILVSHAGLTAALVNARIMGPNMRNVTFETSTSFLASVPADGRVLTATGEVRARRGDVFVLDVEVRDADGGLVLVGSGTQLARDPRRRGASRPSNRVLLTVLFTDVVGSTERITEVGDANWVDQLDQHHAVVRRQIESHMGREVNTTGDGFVATFDSPSRAVECARAIRDAVGRLGLALRAGVHTGECEVVGGDVVGLAVHAASRVQGAAAPGEILVSNTVRDLVAGSALALTDRGPYELKGLNGSWTLWSVEG